MTPSLPLWAQWIASLGPVVITAVLALITALYTKHTAAMVREMRRGGEAEFQPVLVPHVERLPGAGQVRIGVRNVGRGPAIAVDVTLHWGGAFRLRFRRSVIAAGDFHHSTAQRLPGGGADVFFLREPEGRVLSLAGTCRDVAGREYRIDAVAPMLDQWDHNLPEALLTMSNFHLAIAGFEAGREVFGDEESA